MLKTDIWAFTPIRYHKVIMGWCYYVFFLSGILTLFLSKWWAFALIPSLITLLSKNKYDKEVTLNGKL